MRELERSRVDGVARGVKATVVAPAADPQLPGVSVVIPAHNYAHYLPDAIGSVLAQSYPNFEIVVVDDGSTDSTRDVVAGERDPRVRYLWQDNAGLSAARNTGIREARHPFVAFLDADDRWQPGFLEEVMRRFFELGKSFGLVVTNTARIDAVGQPLEMRQVFDESDRELTARHFVTRNRPFSSSAVARREVFEECGGFDVALRSSEDRDMWIRISARHRIWFIGLPLGFIRRHPQNMSRNADRMKRNSAAVLCRAFRRGAVSRLDFAFWLRAFSVHYAQVAWTHFDEAQRLRPLLYLFTSVALCPVFLQPALIRERPFFRLRALARFLLGAERQPFVPATLTPALTLLMVTLWSVRIS